MNSYFLASFPSAPGHQSVGSLRVESAEIPARTASARPSGGVQTSREALWVALRSQLLGTQVTIANSEPTTGDPAARETSRQLMALLLQLGIELAAALAATGPDRGETRCLAEALQMNTPGEMFQLLIEATQGFTPLLEIFREGSRFQDNIPSNLAPCVGHVLARQHSSRVTASRTSRREFSPLSQRETKVLKLISTGLSNKEIAQSLGVAPETVKSHAKHIFAKLEVDTRAAAVFRAMGLSLI